MVLRKQKNIQLIVKSLCLPPRKGHNRLLLVHRRHGEWTFLGRKKHSPRLEQELELNWGPELNYELVLKLEMGSYGGERVLKWELEPRCSLV